MNGQEQRMAHVMDALAQITAAADEMRMAIVGLIEDIQVGRTQPALASMGEFKYALDCFVDSARQTMHVARAPSGDLPS